MSSRVFLQTLQNKLRGGNARSIHLNALPGRLTARLDLMQLDTIQKGTALNFIQTLLSQPNFAFSISFEQLDFNTVPAEEQKKLLILSKRLDAIVIENEDYFKDHGMKTLGFGYPILIKRSTKDPSKVIKAPLFIWPLEAIKSKKKVNEWTLLRNKMLSDTGKFVDAEVHSVAVNEVLLSFIKGEDDIELPGLTNDVLEDMVMGSEELLTACANVLHALNPGSHNEHLDTLRQNFMEPVQALPEASHIDGLANNNAYIHFGGVFGLFRSQKESIITDITRLMDRVDEFQFDNMTMDGLSITPFSAVDTDPSQQAIIGALAESPNQVIQGPPGTGKSQSLTALITNALANHLTCLVVCEKKTALDVIKNNLQRTSEPLGSLVAIIDDVNDDREAIVDSVRDRQERLQPLIPLQQAELQYSAATRAILDSAAQVNSQHQALAKNMFRGQPWTLLVGRYLQLVRSFGKVPLKNVLSDKDFQFQANEEEQEELSGILKKADNLSHRAQAMQETFAVLHPHLFSGMTVGEARLAIDGFTAFARPLIAHIEDCIRQEQAAVHAWREQVYAKAPAVIQQAITPHLPYLEGNILGPNPMLGSQPLEQYLEASLQQLSTLHQKAQAFTDTYHDHLHQHYSGYHEALTSSFTSYLQFIEDNTHQFGPAFVQNTGMARFKTRLLALFSAKYQTLRQQRLLVPQRIAAIREVHGLQSYIDHTYNDHEETIDLTLYIQNIQALQTKTRAWRQAYPAQISAYLDYIAESSMHPALSGLKPPFRFLLNELTDLSRQLHSRCQLTLPAPATDIRSFQHQVTQLKEQIAALQHSFANIREQFARSTAHHDQIRTHIGHLQTSHGCPTLYTTFFPAYHSLPEALAGCEQSSRLLTTITEALPGFRTYHEWKSYMLSLSPEKQTLINTIARHVDTKWSEAFTCWYLYTLLTLFEPPNLPKDDYELRQFQAQKAQFNQAQVHNILTQWTDRQQRTVQAFTARGQSINSLFNKKGSKGMRRNSLRAIIRQQFELFTAFFPVLLVNPSVCSSILPLEEGLFDIIIFDEASQLRLEETFAALIRGKAKIVSGDKHQMAPSSYFEARGAVLDPTDEEEQEDSEDNDEEMEDRQALHHTHRNLADSESLLAYAEDKGFRRRYLDIHYRSRHPALIDFSNHAFYGMRLIPIPASQDYTPITFISVEGLYENQTNPAEALAVLDILQHQVTPYPDGSYPTVGVATFNLYQRNLILEEIAKRRQAQPDFDKLMSQLGDSFFVKNLENIQGDERDIIILSTTFGRKANGSFSQNFGPIIQSRGHRMLNVIITRAKHKIIVCTSFPLEYISQYTELLRKKRNRGRAVLYAYLMYAKAVSDQNHDLRQSILAELNQHCSEKFYDHTESGLGIESESPFEDEVFERLAQHIGADRIIQQHPVGGFRIDMVIRSKNTGRPYIALECDGAKYHSSPEAYAWDIFRQEQLERYGFVFHRIWSTNWWDAADQEMERLLKFIYEQDAREPSKPAPELI